MQQRPTPHGQTVVVEPRNWPAISAIVGVGLLVLGASLVYVSESRHLDDPQPKYLTDLWGATRTVELNGVKYPVPNSEYGEPSYDERQNRKIALGLGVASLTLGAAAFAGAWLMPRRTP